MYQWIRGNKVRPLGRAFIYGALFEKAQTAFTEQSYWGPFPVPALADRQTLAVFHTLHAADTVQKLGMDGELLRQSTPSLVESGHAFAEANGLRQIRLLPSYTIELPLSCERTLPITSQEDVLFVGTYHSSHVLYDAMKAGAKLYQAHLHERLERTGTLERFVKKIPHTFSVTSLRDLPEETPLIPYLNNRFLDPLTLARQHKKTTDSMVLREELESFGSGTPLEGPLRALADAFAQPACRPKHIQEFQATHCALVQYVAAEEYAKAAEAQQLIEQMKVK